MTSTTAKSRSPNKPLRGWANRDKFGYTLSSLTALFGLPASSIRFWFTENVVQGATVATGSKAGSHKYHLSADAYQRVIEFHGVTCTAREASKLVGCSARTMQHLCRAQLIPSVQITKGHRGHRIYRSDLLEFSSALLLAGFAAPEIPERRRIRFSAIVNEKSLKAHVIWTLFLERLRLGLLALHSSVTNPMRLDDLFITRADRDALLVNRSGVVDELPI
ncbi:helix-turn-helix domain-containing protein [Pelomonas sp. KK5]|uniref:helix-turn-helix domain-containing protein n=1 Tax=Pelomonas sp. KK5 TaxID=1855730 RepID=UPI001E4B7165|nr:helix-turn-helix domain-containing protein [Pelomonas sp. KK5]